MDSRQKLEKYIQQHQLRHTDERTSMLNHIISLDAHFTLQMLINDFGTPNHISRASIYRNLNLLIAAEIIIEHPFPGEERTFELMERASTHYHRICTQCGMVKEFRDLKTTKLLKAHRFKGYTMHNSHVYIYGKCSKCKKQ